MSCLGATQTPRRRTTGLLAAALAAGCLWLAACSLHQESLVTVKTLAPTAAECGACHVDIYEEWKVSRHAHAFTAEVYRDQTLDYAVEACIGCHVPASLPEEGEPVPIRTFNREEGVTCIVCHLIDGEHHGPFFAGAMTPHATHADQEFYRDSALCGKCHIGTYRTWRRAREADPAVKTCQQCHMPAVRRKITQGTGLISDVIVALHDEHDLRRHTFDAAAVTAEGGVVAFAVEARSAGESSTADTPGWRVVVRNLLPHGIPTGDFGYRKVVLSVAWDGADGGVGGRVTREFYRDLGTAIAPGAAVAVDLPAGALPRGRRLRVRLERVDRHGRVRSVVAAETIAVETAGGPAQ